MLHTLVTVVHNDKYLDELKELMFELTGTNVSLSTISRTMAALDITHKSVGFLYLF
jgi:hypothetical protein